MPAQSATDAGFYSLVHEVLRAERQQSGDDRRGQSRHPLVCHLLIAPYTEGRLPAVGEFRKVCCQSLSASGMSYLDNAPAKQLRLLVLLGKAPSTVLTAEVVHQSQVDDDAQVQHVIGCQFTGRLVTGGLVTGRPVAGRPVTGRVEDDRTSQPAN